MKNMVRSFKWFWLPMSKAHNALILVIVSGVICLLAKGSAAQPLAAGHDKFLGCGTSHELSRYLIRYWNQVTPGNAGKWGSVEPAQGYYRWENLDSIYNYAIKNGLLYKHHTLVWVSQQPTWIASLDTAAQRAAVEKWMQLVGQRYPQMNMVDVVNEPFHGAPSYAPALGGSGATGYDWVITSFKMARRYCPAGAQLILNEYNVLHDNTVTGNYIHLITLLKERGLIDAIGIQCHYFELRSDKNAANQYVHNPVTLKNNLDRLAALGLPIYISEFDIDEPVDADQLEQYQIYFPVFWNHPAVKGITFWGYIEDDVWTSHPNTYLLLANGAERPAMKWLRTYLLNPVTPVALSPNGAIGEQCNPLLRWRSSKIATSYRVQVSSLRSMTPVLMDSTVSDTLLQLPSLSANTRYFWRVSALNAYGSSAPSDVLFFVTGEQTLVRGGNDCAPGEYRLEQNYPNPFNPVTTVSFQLAREGWVRLQVYDLMGRLIQTLADERKPAGIHNITFNADALGSGVYFYQLTSGSFVDRKRMLLVR